MRVSADQMPPLKTGRPTGELSYVALTDDTMSDLRTHDAPASGEVDDSDCWKGVDLVSEFRVGNSGSVADAPARELRMDELVRDIA